MKRALFLCTGNSCRSQMAEGFLRHLGGGRFEVYSAGTKPTSLNPDAVSVMSEIGIDISKQFSKSVAEFTGKDFDYVITVCDSANESCPVFPGAYEKIHWSFSDPAVFEGAPAKRLELFRTVRDQIKERTTDFLAFSF